MSGLCLQIIVFFFFFFFFFFLLKTNEKQMQNSTVNRKKKFLVQIYIYRYAIRSQFGGFILKPIHQLVLAYDV